MASKRKQDDPLAAMLAAAPAGLLVDLLVRLAATHPDARRECFDYLQQHAALSPSQQRQSEGEWLRALWAELVADLDALDEYGGGDYDADANACKLLQEIEQALCRKKIEASYRHELLDQVLPYIESGNAGVDDALYAVAYATCYSDGDWRALAAALEIMGGDWQRDNARRIYRRLGDRERYLELRQRKLVTGSDYHDLADFHWKAGERQQAIKIAETGLLQGKGRMDELRQFVAKRAKSAGNRERYLTLQFEQAVDPLTCDKYKAFQKLCSAAEWKSYEAEILTCLKSAWDTEQLRIRMHRKEYARQAPVMSKINRVLVDALHDAPRWRDFALKAKQHNIKRPAFQDEFAKAVPGWKELK